MSKKIKSEIIFGEGVWKIGDGPYRKFEENPRNPMLFAECAGIVELTVREKAQLSDLLDELLPPGETKLGCAKGLFQSNSTQEDDRR